MKLNKEEKQQLFERKKVERSLEIELIESKGGKRLWPIINSKSMASIVVEVKEGSESLGVTLRTEDENLNSDGLLGFGTYKCNLLRTKARKTKTVYRAGLDRIEGNKYRFHEAYESMKLVIELDGCWFLGKEKLIECNLKLENLKNLA